MTGRRGRGTFMMIFCFLVINWVIVGFVGCDNYHTEGPGDIFCNGELLDVRCTGERWKISYLGTNDGMRIEEKEGKIVINGAKKTGKGFIAEGGRFYYPNGYELVLDSDTVYRGWISVPKKIINFFIFLLIVIGSFSILFFLIEKNIRNILWNLRICRVSQRSTGEKKRYFSFFFSLLNWLGLFGFRDIRRKQ
ncbi:hypothetical protein NEFER03_0407 [Nematocida sp. LUAm3]|nr:hypothetical protein NEFER03_0407 [Nematocida sp. LUAm3]KAI5175977.1 hypothetical protein NEFER02_1823 [Nematocida sp. LUAm2]KAI5179073.1 hypothetical protein NEFER01_1940 [Nematocida sp. LUAm1]